MADQRGMRRVGLALIQQGLQPPCGPIEEEGFDSVGHVILLPQRTQRQHGGRLNHKCINGQGRKDRKAEAASPKIIVPPCSSVPSVVKLVILSV